MRIIIFVSILICGEWTKWIWLYVNNYNYNWNWNGVCITLTAYTIAYHIYGRFQNEQIFKRRPIFFPYSERKIKAKENVTYREEPFFQSNVKFRPNINHENPNKTMTQIFRDLNTSKLKLNSLLYNGFFMFLRPYIFKCKMRICLMLKLNQCQLWMAYAMLSLC